MLKGFQNSEAFFSWLKGRPTRKIQNRLFDFLRYLCYYLNKLLNLNN